MSSTPSFALPPKPPTTILASVRSAAAMISGGIRLGGTQFALPNPPSFPLSLPLLPPSLPSRPVGMAKPSISHPAGASGQGTGAQAHNLGSSANPGFQPGGGMDAGVDKLEGSAEGNKDTMPSSPKSGGSQTSTTLSIPSVPSRTALGKRKASDEISTPMIRMGSTARSDRALSTFSAAPTSTTIDTKPLLPVPMLPLPLPSKRFKKSASSKAVLIPVEQLPVYPLPPLPPIRDAALAKQVFIHSSCFPKTRGRFEDSPEKPTEHYEKLEHVGDSILGMVVTAWLHEIKPGLSCGTASKLKAHLVSNATLSHISGMYNFPQRLQGDPHILPVLRAQTDVRAAMVEAYIAALYFSFPVEQRLGEGIRVIDAWLREMYEPLFDFFYEYMKSEYEQHHLTLSSTLSGGSHLYTEDEIAHIDNSSQGMANLLKMYCYRQDRELHFEEERYETHCGILWRLKCLVDGIEVGEATRSGRKVAKNVSAWEACRRLGLVKDEESESALAAEGEKGTNEVGEETVIGEDSSQ